MSEADSPPPRSDQLADAPHPRFAAQIYGHRASIETFTAAAAQGHLPHAWLICGPNGIGKASLAWRLAKTIVSGGTLHPDLPLDGDAAVLRRINACTEPRLISVTRPYDEKKKRLKTAITVDEIRNLKHFFTLSVADGGWRVALIDAADELNPSASNALLKLLEAPPARSLFLLICHQAGKLLPTLKSRSRILRLYPLAATDLNAVLAQTGYAHTAQNSDGLAALCQGSVGMAIRLLDHDGLVLYRQILTLARQHPHLDRHAITTLAKQAQGAQNQPRYALICDLFHLFLARLACFGANKALHAATEEETACFNTLCQTPQSGVKWAQLQSHIVAQTTQAQAINLDPAQVILDMLLQFESAAKV